MAIEPESAPATTQASIPENMARLWRIPAGSGLGRPPALDIDAVVGAAVDLADKEGLAGVTLPKVADALGVTKMALYRHVGSKDELITLMADEAIRPESAPPVDSVDWRSGLERWAMAQRKLYEHHRWLPDVPKSGPPAGPHAIAWMDALLRSLAGTGLSWEQKMGVLGVLGGFVETTCARLAQLERFRRSRQHSQMQIEYDYGTAMAALVDSSRFPEVAALLGAGPFGLPEPDGHYDDAEFAFGLELVLDGVAATISAAQS